MILNREEIKRYLESGRLYIDPFNPDYLQPSSYDLHLHKDILVYASNRKVSQILSIAPQGDWLNYPYQYVDKGNGDQFIQLEIPEGGFPLYPDQCILARTIEYFRFPDNVVGKLEGVSTNARLFLSIHSTAGHFDQNFQGTATLEIKNDSPRVTVLLPNCRIGQMIFYVSGKDAYDGRYQGQINATPARDPKLSSR